jgi:transposase
VARRYQRLSEEINELDEQLGRLVAEAAPGLVSLPAIGTDHAATLLIVAGDNLERLGSEASFASLCGVSPIEASSGKVVRHCLNRGGNREANRALHLICMVRMPEPTHQRVRVPAHRRRQEQAGNHALPQTLHSPGGIPCTSISCRGISADDTESRSTIVEAVIRQALTIGASL